MITPEKAQADYETAVAALQQIAMTPGVSSAERLAVRGTIRDLTDKYLGQLEAEVHALTEQYTGFMQSMAAVIETLTGGSTPTNLLNRLTGLVTDGTELLGSITGAARSGAKGFGGGRGRAAGGSALRILCVHGVGHQENDPAFESTWTEAITRGLVKWRTDQAFEIEFVAYDDLF